MSDPYNTAQPAADRREMMSDDPHNEFDANRALADTARLPKRPATAPKKEAPKKGNGAYYVAQGITLAVATGLGIVGLNDAFLIVLIAMIFTAAAHELTS